jgi:hypothetical protein
MKGKLFLGVIVAACFVLPAQSVQAFDPGACLQRGIMKLDSRAAETIARNGNDRKDFAAGKNHNDAVNRVKSYLKAETRQNTKRYK